MCTKVRLAIFPKNLFLGQTGNLGQIWFKITLPYISWLSVRIFKNILSWWNTKCTLKERYSILPKIFFFQTKKQFVSPVMDCLSSSNFESRCSLLGVAFIRHFSQMFKISLLSGQTLTNLCISTHGLWINNSHRI